LYQRFDRRPALLLEFPRRHKYTMTLCCGCDVAGVIDVNGKPNKFNEKLFRGMHFYDSTFFVGRCAI